MPHNCPDNQVSADGKNQRQLQMNNLQIKQNKGKMLFKVRKYAFDKMNVIESQQEINKRQKTKIHKQTNAFPTSQGDNPRQSNRSRLNITKNNNSVKSKPEGQFNSDVNWSAIDKQNSDYSDNNESDESDQYSFMRKNALRNY